MVRPAIALFVVRVTTTLRVNADDMVVFVFLKGQSILTYFAFDAARSFDGGCDLGIRPWCLTPDMGALNYAIQMMMHCLAYCYGR